MNREIHSGCPRFERGVALFVLAFLCGAVPGAAHDGNAARDARVSCFVSILPQAFLVQRIGGPYVDVHVMVGPGQTPHTFEPTARLLSELSASQVYFAIGIAFEEPLLKRIESNFKDVKVVDASAGIVRRRMEDDQMEAAQTDTASSGVSRSAPSDARPHGTPDPHVWLSPRLAVRIARNVRDALVMIDPEHASVYTANCRRLETELVEVDREIADMMAPYKGRDVLVFHPAYGYFMDAYGLRQVAIEKEGRAPGPRHLAEVIEEARAKGVTTIFVQPQVSTTQANTIARAIGAEVVELDPLAFDYIDNLRRMGRAIADSFDKTHRDFPR